MIFETKLTLKKEVQDSSINFVKNKQHMANKKYSNNNNNNAESPKFKVKAKKKCNHCGWKTHNSMDCRYKNKSCNACGKKGHLASICRSKNDKNVNFISNCSNRSEIVSNAFEFSLYSIAVKGLSEMYNLPVEVDGLMLEATCDTGAPCTIIPKSTFSKIGLRENLKTCKIPYVDYSGDKIEIIGEYDATVTYRGITKKINVVVSNRKSTIARPNIFESI